MLHVHLVHLNQVPCLPGTSSKLGEEAISQRGKGLFSPKTKRLLLEAARGCIQHLFFSTDSLGVIGSFQSWRLRSRLSSASAWTICRSFSCSAQASPLHDKQGNLADWDVVYVAIRCPFFPWKIKKKASQTWVNHFHWQKNACVHIHIKCCFLVERVWSNLYMVFK